jgi:hypothetical protein
MANVPKDYAALIAQVVPVLAIALGLETRSRVRLLKAAIPKEYNPDKKFDRERNVVLYLALGLLFLAIIEVRSLHEVAGSASVVSQWVIGAAVVTAFLAPALDAFRVASWYEGQPMTFERYRRLNRSEKTGYLFAESMVILITSLMVLFVWFMLGVDASG